MGSSDRTRRLRRADALCPEPALAGSAQCVPVSSDEAVSDTAVRAAQVNRWLLSRNRARPTAVLAIGLAIRPPRDLHS
jgi:hypothetical protein